MKALSPSAKKTCSDIPNDERAESVSERIEFLDAENDRRLELVVTKFLGALILILATFGCIAFFVPSVDARDVWQAIGPILMLAIGGFVSILGGRKPRKRTIN